jgi:hypothetical protein
MVRVVLTYGPTSPRLRADLSSLTGRLVSVRVVRGPSCLAPDSPCHFENQGKMGEVVQILGCAHFKKIRDPQIVKYTEVCLQLTKKYINTLHFFIIMSVIV